MKRGPPRCHHAGQVVQGGIDVRAAHALDQGAGDVVVSVAVAVVAGDERLHGALDRLDIDDGALGHPGGCSLQRRERARASPPASRIRAARASSASAQRPPRPRSLPRARSMSSPRSASESAVSRMTMDLDNSGVMTAKEGVLGGGGHQRDPAVLDRRQQRVLLGLGEPVDLVDEQHRRAPRHQLISGGGNHRAHVLDPAVIAESSTSRRSPAAAISEAMVVLPDPGGPHSTTEDQAAPVAPSARPPATRRRSGEPGARASARPTTSSSDRGRMRAASGAPGRSPPSWASNSVSPSMAPR